MGYLKKPPKNTEKLEHLRNHGSFNDSNNERASMRSSDDARSTASPGLLDESGLGLSPNNLDERSRLIAKIEKVREKITRLSITHEGDIDEYLKIAENPRLKQENPQLTRIKQHFERKNKKYSQAMETLQKKLDEAEQRLDELDRGAPEATKGHSMLHNVGHGIKRTGVNLKEMTGSVISAPRDIAQKVKKNMFGSADNIPVSINPQDHVGQSTFYTKSSTLPQGSSLTGNNNIPTTTITERGRASTTHGSNAVSEAENDEENSRHKSIGNRQQLPQHYGSSTRNYKDIDSEQVKKLFEESDALKKKCGSLENANHELNGEIGVLRNDLAASRFQVQKLEQTLNETMEVHQNEMKQLKNDLNLIGTRMDYQYNDRFKRIEEAVESSQNHMYRIETNIHENSLKMGKSNAWNNLMLSGANIIVEFLKIALYFIAVILDFLKPLTGTRKRAGILLFALITFFVLWSIFDVSVIVSNIFTRKKTIPLESNSSPSSSMSNSSPEL
jgi:DNA-binding ferritin-like protein